MKTILLDGVRLQLFPAAFTVEFEESGVKLGLLKYHVHTSNLSLSLQLSTVFTHFEAVFHQFSNQVETTNVC
jgi:hypothetical protein